MALPCCGRRYLADRTQTAAAAISHRSAGRRDRTGLVSTRWMERLSDGERPCLVSGSWRRFCCCCSSSSSCDGWSRRSTTGSCSFRPTHSRRAWWPRICPTQRATAVRHRSVATRKPRPPSRRRTRCACRRSRRAVRRLVAPTPHPGDREPRGRHRCSRGSVGLVTTKPQRGDPTEPGSGGDESDAREPEGADSVEDHRGERDFPVDAPFAWRDDPTS